MAPEIGIGYAFSLSCEAEAGIRLRKDNIMLKIVLPGFIAVCTLVAMVATGAYAIVHEPLAWVVFIVEAMVLLGMFLRLRHAMRELGDIDEE